MPDVYVDSFVMTVQKNKVEDYQKFGERMAAPAKEHGALEYVNLASDDVKPRRKTYLPQQKSCMTTCSLTRRGV